MDSGGLSSIFQTAKTKLIILSSLLGVGTIIYFTKNYIQHGTFLVTHEGPHNKRPVIVGGKRVVINESSQDVSGKQLKGILKKRSRTSSRASSSRISSRRSSRKNSFASNVNSSQRQLSRLSSLSTFDDESVPLATDEDLTKAVEELSKSVYELEEVLGVNNNQPSNQPSDVVEEEVQRLRSLLDIAQDTHHVMSKANEFIAAQQAEEIEASMVGESCSAYDDLVENIRMMKSQEYESDSEESFLSAAESVEIQFSDDEQYVNVLAFERKLKDLIKNHSSDDFYMLGIEYLTQYGVPVRSVRTDLVKCENDVDFCVKVHCLRMAFQNLLKDKECRRWFVASGKEMLITLLKKSKYDEVSFSKDFDIMIDYCSDIKNWPLIEEELSSRGVCALSFYDIVLDFMVMDSFADLESPPSAVTAAINNRWLSDRFKETALATAVWSVIKGKKSMLQHQDGFFAKFYDISMNLTPMLAWGFLGPVKELNYLCQSFKNSMLGFMCDIFNPQQASYKSVEDLSIDIFRLAKKRKDELLAMIT